MSFKTSVLIWFSRSRGTASPPASPSGEGLGVRLGLGEAVQRRPFLCSRGVRKWSFLLVSFKVFAYLKKVIAF